MAGAPPQAVGAFAEVNASSVRAIAPSAKEIAGVKPAMFLLTE